MICSIYYSLEFGDMNDASLSWFVSVTNDAKWEGFLGTRGERRFLGGVGEGEPRLPD